MPELSLDHVQIAAPAGCEAAARRFFGDLLGLAEIEKPAPLSARGGGWFALGDRQLHVGVDPDFEPARKAHVAVCVGPPSSTTWRHASQASGAPSPGTTALPGERRFYSTDPWGNRIEFLARAE